MRWWVVALAGAVVACSPGEVDLDGKACPCVVGWVCDEAMNLCVRGDASTLDSGPVDSGSSTDTGAADAAPPDAAVDSAAGSDGGDGAIDGGDAGGSDSACDGALADAIFCDGFEDGPGFAAWSEDGNGGGTASWSEDVVYRGLGALRAESTMMAGSVFMWGATSAAIDSGDLWLRLYALFPAESSLYHFDFANVSPADGGGMTLYVEGGRLRVWNEGLMMSHASTTMVPLDTWTCIELHVSVGDSGGFEAFIDGALVSSAMGEDTFPEMPYDTVATGFIYSDPDQPPSLFYVDEVAVGTSRLPCD